MFIEDLEIVVVVINEYFGYGGLKVGFIVVCVIDVWYWLNGECGQRVAAGDGRVGSKL